MPPPMPLVTCEHASNRVPAVVGDVFRPRARRLESHAGFDRGAAEVARTLGRRLRTRPILGTVTRLAIDLNRSPDNPRRFSPASRRLDSHARAALTSLHDRHWARVDAAIQREVEAGRAVLHVGVHSFTPVLRGRVRPMDIGLLYDPSRPGERRLALSWCRELRQRDPGLVVRRNAPYRGTADGLTRGMRQRWPDAAYVGVELELNQRWLRDGRFPSSLVDTLIASLCAAIRGWSADPP